MWKAWLLVLRAPSLDPDPYPSAGPSGYGIDLLLRLINLPLLALIIAEFLIGIGTFSDQIKVD